jgi:protein-tyrosine kinase
LRFGDAAIQLRLLTPADIDFALSRQFDYPYLRRGDNTVSEDVVAAHAPFSPKVEALREVRSRLMVRWFDVNPANKVLAVVSAERKEGRSFIAANLAVVLSQLGKRTLLIDADLRNPSQHRLFNLDNGGGLSETLAGRGKLEMIKSIAPLRNLSLLPSGTLPPNAADLLARPLLARLLQDLVTRFEFIIVDTPAAQGFADAQTIAAHAGAALIVALRNTSRISQVRGLATNLADAKATVVGTVLNDV